VNIFIVKGQLELAGIIASKTVKKRWTEGRRRKIGTAQKRLGTRTWEGIFSTWEGTNRNIRPFDSLRRWES